ncbi:hypothetical protein F0562_022282 [Nyssa sinensis]|uniref:Cupin type-1 domain-containing protein n=1 Tax=Nyssa sinensis TaxID=561372 RepID=A0A5J5BQ84_9ASTE|nr:hypothetical protein F0562_022282 [Nyssa sinensis]
MASTLLNYYLCLLLAIFAASWMVQASDPDITSDFIVPPNSNNITGNFFTFTGLCSVFDPQTPPNFKVTKVSMAEFPALNGQSVSLAMLQFPAGGVNPPHTHPRSAELLFVVEGSLEVPATAVSAFGSANAGTVSVPTNLFTTGIDDGILAKSFKTDLATIQKIMAGLAPKA